ncbi:MAG: DsbA family protein [Glaciimonas sp.]|nr:DsbA family protein [Glaciimonas sp.]
MNHLIYIADPMCSWCYGFGPQLNALLDALPEAQLDIVMGGLRAYNTEVMDDARKATILTHWKHVEEASGLPFSTSGMARPGFIYDTEPACRAVVTARILGEDLPPRKILDVFHAIQHAFYAEGRDVTNLQVLAEVGATALADAYGQSSLAAQPPAPIDSTGFLQTLSAASTISETRQDFAQTQQWGIQGFPALVLKHDATLHLVSSGFTKTAVLMERIQAITHAAL